jgi:hypothetical protein
MAGEKDLGVWGDLKIFESKGARVKDNRITITEESTILFNAGFCHRATLNDTNYVVLAYSKKNNAIAFKFISEKSAPGALKIIRRGSSASIGTRSFFTYNLLDPKEWAGHYEPFKEQDLPTVGEAWIIRLDSKIPEKSKTS